MNRFWNWARDEDTGERTLYLNGAIAEESWFDDDVTPAAFKAELLSGEGDITVWINSPGGDCLAASQIYNMLMDYKGNVTVKIDSIAASAASVIAMAGTKVLISPTGLIFVHNPASVAIGNTDEMRKAIQMLDEVKESILNAYEIKTGLTRARLSHLMDDETWMNAKMAIDLGFADGLLFEPQKDEQPDETLAVGNSYTYSCNAVSNSLLGKIVAKIHNSIPPVSDEAESPAPASAPTPTPTPVAPLPDTPAAEPEVPDTAAPTVSEETAPTPPPAENQAEMPDEPAGVSISALERRLDLLKPYGMKP